MSFRVLFLLIVSVAVCPLFGQAAPSNPKKINNLSRDYLNVLEKRWNAEFEKNQRQYEFDEGTSKEKLKEIASRVKKSFSNWISCENGQREKYGKLEYFDFLATDSFLAQKFSFKTVSGITTTGIVSEPSSVPPPWPVIILPTATSSNAETLFGLPKSDYHQSVAKVFAPNYYVLAVNIPPTEMNSGRAQFVRTRAFLLANSLGVSWRSLQVVPRIQGALDFAKENEKIDMSRIAIYGISMGGEAAVIASLCEPRISVSVVSGSNVLTPHNFVLLQGKRFIYPSFYEYAAVHRPTFAQLLYARFPKRTILELNMRDTSGFANRAIIAAKKLKDYFRLRGANENVDLIVFDEDGPSQQGHYMRPVVIKNRLDEIFSIQKHDNE